MMISSVQMVQALFMIDFYSNYTFPYNTRRYRTGKNINVHDAKLTCYFIVNLTELQKYVP